MLSFECDGLFDEMEDSEGFGAELFELGDIVIAVDVVERQAGGYGNTFEQEVQLMLVHGLLHLCGYDHIEDDEAEEMESLQADLLAAWSCAGVRRSAVNRDDRFVRTEESKREGAAFPIWRSFKCAGEGVWAVLTRERNMKFTYSLRLRQCCCALCCLFPPGARRSSWSVLGS